jgi:hypothetical protein
MRYKIQENSSFCTDMYSIHINCPFSSNKWRYFLQINGDEFLFQGSSHISVFGGLVPNSLVQVYQELIHHLPM